MIIRTDGRVCGVRYTDERPYIVPILYGRRVLKMLFYVQNSPVYDNCAHACRDFYSKQTQTVHFMSSNVNDNSRLSALYCEDAMIKCLVAS